MHQNRIKLGESKPVSPIVGDITFEVWAVRNPDHSMREPLGSQPHNPLLSLKELREIHIRSVLTSCKGNRVRAAKILGIGRTSLYRYLKSDIQRLNETRPTRRSSTY